MKNWRFQLTKRFGLVLGGTAVIIVASSILLRWHADNKRILARQPAPRLNGSYTNSVGMKFVHVTAGSFLMSSPAGEEGRMPSELQHWVTLTQPFYIATTTVTQAQWKAVIGADPSHFKGDDLPVECVSWNDALRFCKKLSEMEGKKYRLPTEAEWECCCRAGAQTPFYTGSTITTDQANYNGNYVYGNGPKGTFRQKTTPVGVFKPNAWGLFDMHANVREWCWDGFDEFEKLNDDDAVDPAGADWSLMRVQRGGSWNDPPYGRSAGRSFYKADETSNEAGFRVCLEFERFSGNSK